MKTDKSMSFRSVTNYPWNHKFLCWFNRPRLNQNVSVQATSLNQRRGRFETCHT